MFHRGRRTSYRLLACALFAGLTARSALTFGDAARPSAPYGPQGSSQPNLGDGMADHHVGSCNAHEQCDDGDPCTNDLCAGGMCQNTRVPGCVPCEPGFICPPTEVVFIMDTSGSMRDEAGALCAGIEAVLAELAAKGNVIEAHILGITDQGSGSAFSCLTDNVVNLLGGAVPGPLAFCPFPDELSSFESWGPATAIVADRFPWIENHRRLIIPISDEGACNGSRPDGCSLFGDDRDSVDNAAIVAFKAGVVASPITGSGADACVRELAELLGTQTGGTFAHTKDSKTIPDAIEGLIGFGCDPDPDCDDLNECTSGDTCTNNACLGTLNYDPTLECCNPSDGTSIPVEDGNGCTVDTCDPATGLVTHTPEEPGVACDDGDECTAQDTCVADEGCVGIDINTIPCTSSADCFGAFCDSGTGFCVCANQPTLCLNPLPSGLSNDTCYIVGDEITIHVDIDFSTQLVASGTFLTEYDPTVLEFIDIRPGADVDPLSPFSVELFRTIDETTGRIEFGVSVEAGNPGTNGPALMAAITFRGIDACSTSEALCLLDGSPVTTRLNDANGNPVPFDRCCTPPIGIDGLPPVFVCPPSVEVNARAGGTTATLQWNPVTVTSECDPGLTFSCTAENSFGANINNLIDHGGLFPSGISVFTCSAEDSCGAESVCEWTVNVRLLNTLEVDLELSPTLTSDPALQPLERCIEFELFSNCVQQPLIVQQTVEFGLPFNLPGHAQNVILKVPAGQYACVTARDPLHTLRSSSPLQIVDGRYLAAFEGDPFFEGNWLIGGNLDGDSVIDIVDYGILISQYLSARPSDTPCDGTDSNADFNGDGRVDSLDLSFISLNFSKTDKDKCCPDAVASVGPVARTEVPVAKFREMGVRRWSALDADGNGLFDMRDVSAFFGRSSAPDGRMSHRPGR